VNRKIEFADSKYVVLDNPYHLIMYNGTRALPILLLKWPIHIAFIHYSATDQDRSIKFGSKFGKMDFCTNLMLKVQPNPWWSPWTEDTGWRVWVWRHLVLGPRDQISKFWDPL